MVPCWVDVRSGASGYGCYWFYVEMARSVNVIILRRNGETIFDYLFHVFPVRMGFKDYRCAALHDFSRGYRGHKKYNAENYEAISSITRVVAPGLLIVAKSVVSLGSVLMFSGLWLK